MNARTFAHHHGSFTVGEASNASPESALLFCAPERGEFNMLIQFEHMNLGLENGKFSPRPLADGELAEVFTRWQNTLGDRGWNALYLENHDQPRSVSRFGDPGSYWHESATALATAYFLQRGTPFIYQGQEIGMLGGSLLNRCDFRDVESLNFLAGLEGDEVPVGLAAMSRDNGRTPMQWDDSPTAGFTSSEPWIDIPPSAAAINVAAQIQDPGSILSYYKALIDARHRVPALTEGSFERIDVGSPPLFVYRRWTAGSEVLVMVNLSGSVQTPHFPAPDEAWAPSRWNLYLGNTDVPLTTDSLRSQDGADRDVRPHDSMKPWEARVYLRVL